MDNFFTDGMKRGELKEDDFFHVPQEEISTKSCMSISTAKREMISLVKEGFIEKTNTRNKSFYRVNLKKMNDFISGFDIETFENDRLKELVSIRNGNIRRSRANKRQQTSI